MTKDISQLKVAIVHDWLVGGGAELVIEELHKLFPDAPIYTSYATKEWQDRLDGKVITAWLQRWPFSRLRKFIPPLRILWFESLKLDNYDLVITSSGNGEAFGVKTSGLHINYCHSPTHYYWRHYEQYLARPGFGLFDPLARIGLKLLVGPLRAWDYKAAQRADFIIANSSHIKAEIKQWYDRDSVVVHPPINTERFMAAAALQREGFVTMGRQVTYKRTDLIIEACNQLRLPLTVIGRGPDHDRLVKMAGPTITFLTTVTDAEMPALLASAQAFIFAAYEDFGIAPVEAMATGTPVIAYQAGGALDYVVPGKTGEFFKEQTTDSLVAALKSFNVSNYSSDDIKNHAISFSNREFQKNIQKTLLTSYTDFTLNE